MTHPARSGLVRRAAWLLGLEAAILGSAVVVLLSSAAVVVVVQGLSSSAVAELDVATIRADDISDPPAWMMLAIRGDPGEAGTGVDPAMPPGLPDVAAMDRVGAGGPTELHETTAGGVDYLVETMRHANGWTVQAVLDLTPNHTVRDQLIHALLLAGGAGLVLATLIGTWLGRRALAPLSTALEVQRRFVADAGHELRTPVTLLHTRAQLLQRRLRRDPADAPEPTGSVQHDVDGLVADSGRLTDILEELLLAADPAGERAPQPIELGALVRGVVASAGAHAATQDVVLSGPPPDAPPVRVSGLPVALSRAVTALVDNAVRHADGEVRVSVGEHRRDALIDVVDDGPGIDPELAPHVFDRFVTGRGGAVANRRRYGIGLSLVNEIAAAHGGRVELLDRPGPGAALRIVLPRARPRWFGARRQHP